MKLSFIDNLLRKYKKRWIKPYIAAGLGALLAGFSTYATNANILNSIVAGLMAGLAAVGMHEVANKRRAEKRDS